jgi:ribosomal protein S18 acetylase RimI-like enzyme
MTSLSPVSAPQPTIRTITGQDLPVIDRIFCTSFCATFASLYRSVDLGAFLSGFTAEAWAAELADPGYDFRLGEIGGRPVGYAKIGPNKLPHIAAPEAVELKQLYLLPEAHGTGLAQLLMDWALAEAKARGAPSLSLSVWSENKRAQAFYRRYGFVDRGPVTFMVGTHADEDRVWETSL